METLVIHTGAPIVYWEYTTSCIYVVEAKIVTPRVKHTYIPVCFIQEQFGRIFQNIISPVLSRKICAPNHVQVQFSVGVINGLLGSDYTQPVIQNIINS